MNRNSLLKMLDDKSKIWDVIVIGGGATGLGIAVDAALRGLDVVLFEAYDFAKATSSRSTKLVHGGVRYLAQGDVALVLEALYERGLLLKNAPHLAKNQSFLIPNYTHWNNLQYTVGLKMYDWMAGKLGLGHSIYISKERALKDMPILNTKGLKGGVIYHDGQFDDARLAINLAQSAVANGACVLNYIPVKEITHDKNGVANGVVVKDTLNNKQHTVHGKTIINATGVFVDDILQMDNPTSQKMVRPSQGVHLVIDMKFLQSDYALMIPKTSDGRVLFAVPWHEKVVVGTTDNVMDETLLEPIAMEKEIDFILETASEYMNPAPKRSDVLSVFAGLRPLAAPKTGETSSKEISRSHKIVVSPHKLITIVGGKWTTYRRMAEDTLNKAEELDLIPHRNCTTKDFKIFGYKTEPNFKDHFYVYGSEAGKIQELIKNDESLGEKIHQNYDYTLAEVVWGVREEMAEKVEDILARRIRLLLLDAKAALEAAPLVAKTMAKELGKDKEWEKQEVSNFEEIAKHYIISE